MERTCINQAGEKKSYSSKCSLNSIKSQWKMRSRNGESLKLKCMEVGSELIAGLVVIINSIKKNFDLESRRSLVRSVYSESNIDSHDNHQE